MFFLKTIILVHPARRLSLPVQRLRRRNARVLARNAYVIETMASSQNTVIPQRDVHWMDVFALKIYRKLKQLKTSFDLEMSSMLPPKEFEMLPPRQKTPPTTATMDIHQVAHHQEDGSDIENQENADDNVNQEETNYDYGSKEAKNLHEILHEHLPQIKLSFEKWGEAFKECESFENLYPTRLDEIIREAKELEQQLKLQKESLKERLRFLTRTLASTPPDSE